MIPLQHGEGLEAVLAAALFHGVAAADGARGQTEGAARARPRIAYVLDGMIAHPALRDAVTRALAREAAALAAAGWLCVNGPQALAMGSGQ